MSHTSSLADPDARVTLLIRDHTQVAQNRDRLADAGAAASPLFPFQDIVTKGKQARRQQAIARSRQVALC